MKHKNISVSCGVLFIRRNRRPNASLKDSCPKDVVRRAFWRGSSGRAFWESILVAFLLGISFISRSQVINTIAGNSTPATVGNFSGDGGPATAADLDDPYGVAVDASGNVYIVDYQESRVRKINTSGIISTFAGSTSVSFSGDGKAATAAGLDNPYGIAVDASGNVYIADYEHERIRKVNTSGIINTIAGNGGHGYTGDGGVATAAELYLPTGVAVDASGNVYIADMENKRIREVNTSGIISTFAGNGTGTTAQVGDGGPATAAEFDFPYGVAVDVSGNVYIADYGENRVRRVNTSGTINTFAGNGTGSYGGDGGAATAAKIDNPYGVAVDASGNVYIADQGENRVRKVNTSGIISTFAGTGTANYYGDGGSPVAAELHGPRGVGLDAFGNVYIADNGNNRIREVTASPLTISGSVLTNVHCNGGSTGSASATASGGTSPYTYSWSPDGQTNSSVSTLSAGTYTVTVRDNTSSTATASVTITQPNTLSIGASVLSNACNGTSNGNAETTPSGGTSPYTYSWSNGITSNPTGATLSVGTYKVTVQDNCGNSATASVTIKQSTAIKPTPNIAANVSCNGGSNGVAKASAKGGTAPYAYFWSPNTSSTYIASGLSAGTYTVTVVDNNGCNASSSTTLTQPTLLKDSVSTVTYPQCGGETASATIGVTGGTSPYRYTWSPNVSTTASATGLTIRGYVVQVKDVNGCYNDLSFSITQPPIPVLRDSIVRAATVNVSCNGSSNGSATVGVKYGTTPYTYSWSVGGGTNATINGLSVGTYSVTVNDAGGCTATASVSIGQSSSPLSSVTAFVAANVSCNGGSNGVAKVSVSGGSSPYTYSWLSPASGSTYIASGLSVGTYTVTVTDNCGTSASSSVTVTQPAILSDSVITSSIVSPPCSGGGTGSAAIGVTGGTSPYRYTWSPNVSTTDSASGLTVRGYVVQVKDKNGCYNDVTINVTCSSAPATAIYKDPDSYREGTTCCPSSDNINLYPNPNTGQFTLSGLQQGMVLEMYDYTGKMISTMTTTNETMQLNILNQANGIYLIRILDKDGKLVSEKKVVKTQ